jgi:very-short-patch-repair endonuclease
LLRRYLDFAKEGRLPAETVAPTGESESPFELSVWQALRGLGMEVDRQVGTSRYRIDMAIKDPERPGRYLLGVECDGATYHSSVVARDRDRLRQQILEDLGWKIHRIWSTDWVRDPKGCLLRLLQRIDELRGLPEDLGNTTVVEATVELEPATEEDDGAGTFSEEPLEDDPYRNHPEIGVLHETPGGFRPKDDIYANDALIDDDLMRVVSKEGPIHEDRPIGKARSADVSTNANWSPR